MDIENALQHVKGIFEQHPEHRKAYTYREKFGHTMRVYKWARTLLETEKADADILLMAVVFHDVGYVISPSEHAQISADICRKYLTENHCEIERINKICEIILNHDEKQLLHVENTSMEQILMIEADNLDESGILSVLRDTLAVGKEESSDYNSAYERILKHPVSEQRINSNAVTPTAIRIWERKRDEYAMCISALERDLA